MRVCPFICHGRTWNVKTPQKCTQPSCTIKQGFMDSMMNEFRIILYHVRWKRTLLPQFFIVP